MSDLITTTEELTTFCKSLKGEPYVTVDTEFMRERSYYSKLCLIQLGSSKQAVAVDPLAKGIDLAPLFKVMMDTKIVKVFHAARQDVEIFVNLMDKVPTPLFDTQIAAMVCGFGESVGYESLVGAIAKKKVDKSSRFTDWARRPLTAKQVEYALADVTHLRVIYEKLSQQVQKSGREDWVQEEMDVLTSVDTYKPDPYEMWRKIKSRIDKPRRLAILRELTAWRELEAQKTNQPRGRVLKDDALSEIANMAPSSVEELARARSLSKNFAEGRLGKEIIAAVEKGKACPDEACPEKPVKKPSPNGSAAVHDLLRVLLRQVSSEHDVAAKLIASSDDLELIACEDDPDVKALKGWRGKLFGDQAKALKQGKLALAVQKHKVKLIKL